MGGERAGAIARMNACLLDVLHDAGDEGVLAVAQAIDIDLDGVSEVAVDQEGTLLRHDQFGGLIERG